MIKTGFMQPNARARFFAALTGGKSFLNACLTLPSKPGSEHDRFSARTAAIAPDNPEIVYSTGRLRYGGSVIISRDGGKTWSRGPEPYQLQPNENYTGFSIIALKNKKVLLTTLKGGLFLSEDEANSWQEVDTGLKPEEGWKFFRLYPSKVDCKRVYAVATAVSACSMYTLGGTTPQKLSRKVYGIYRSEDEGRTWHPLSNDLEGIGMAGIAFARDEKIMYAVGGSWNEGVKEKEGKISHETGGVFKSEDGGLNWKRLLSGSARDIDLNPKNHDIVYIVSDGVKDASAGRDKRGIIRSLDGGKNWECVGNKITPALICVAIDPYDPSIIYVGTRGSGAWKGIDGYVKKTLEKKGGGIGNWLKNIFGGVIN